MISWRSYRIPCVLRYFCDGCLREPCNLRYFCDGCLREPCNLPYFCYGCLREVGHTSNQNTASLITFALFIAKRYVLHSCDLPSGYFGVLRGTSWGSFRALCVATALFFGGWNRCFFGPPKKHLSWSLLGALWGPFWSSFDSDVGPGELFGGPFGSPEQVFFGHPEKTLVLEPSWGVNGVNGVNSVNGVIVATGFPSE